MTTEQKNFYGYISTERENGQLKNYVLRAVNTYGTALKNGTTQHTLDRATYESKYNSLRLLGLNELPDNLFEYSLEITPENIYFSGITELSVRIAFVNWYSNQYPTQILTMNAERVITFITRPKAETSEIDDVPSLNIFGDIGDY